MKVRFYLPSNRKIISGILTLSIMLIIFLFSSQTGPVSSKVSTKVAKVLVKAGYSYDARKSAHIFLYFCLGVSSTLFLHECCIKRKNFFAFVFCLLYSCSDEWHQTFVSGRSGQLRDVGIDAIGFTIGIILVWYLKSRKMKSIHKNNYML